MGKKSGSVYSGTRNGDWIKLKCDTRQEFVIGGYTLTYNKSSGVSALLLGIYEDGDLVYAGRAGTGFTEQIMKELEAEFENKKRNEAPFKQAPRPKSTETFGSIVLVSGSQVCRFGPRNAASAASFRVCAWIKTAR